MASLAASIKVGLLAVSVSSPRRIDRRQSLRTSPPVPSRLLIEDRRLAARALLVLWSMALVLALSIHATTSFSPSRSARSQGERLRPAAVFEP